MGTSRLWLVPHYFFNLNYNYYWTKQYLIQNRVMYSKI